jgi:Holliday junction resolvase RusA-like endonuclease
VIGTYAFEIPGIPVAKGRARFSARGGFARAYTPKKTRDAELTLAARAMEFRPAEPLGEPLKLTVTFVLPVPQSKPKKWLAAPPAHTTKPDLDNLLKLLKDALNGVFWLDDKQIVEVWAAKRYGSVPRTMVTIEVAA